MNKLCAYNCKSEYFTIYPVDLDYVINNIYSLKFNTILYDPKLEIEEGILEFTDLERPFSIGYDYVFKNYFGINGEYFNNHKKEVRDCLKKISSKIETVYLYVDKELVNDEIVEILKNNKGIKELVISNTK